jgi:hypothetical protein
LAGCPELGQKKLKELKKVGHLAKRLQASFDKCWADARAHAAERDNKYNMWWKEMLANQGVRIALLKATSAAKKRNTDLASSPSTTSTPVADDASPPEAQEGTADELVVV